MPERIFPPTGLQSSRSGFVASPFQFYTTGEEHLRVESYNSAPGVSVGLHYRFLNPDNTITASGESHVPNTDRTLKRTTHPLGAGALLNLTIFAEAGSPQIGQTFVRVQLIRGLSGAQYVLGTLAQGYVTGSQDLAYPGTPLRMSTEDAFPVRVIIGTDPAAGVEISETVPTGALWELVGFLAQLTTNAAVVARRPALVFDDGTNGYMIIPTYTTALDLDTAQFQWCMGVAGDSGATGTDRKLQGLPPGPMLRGGFHITTSTEGLQAGDNWEFPRILVREQLEVT